MLSDKVIRRRFEMLPFERRFYGLPPIAPDADNTIGLRRKRFDAGGDTVNLRLRDHVLA
jgi:hypothetical protein